MIQDTIGRGGMAAVYLAMDQTTNSACAIKEMSISHAANNEQAQAIQNFLVEAKILSRLRHPNLPAFTDFFTEADRRFLVMEYINGSTLEELLERNEGPFTERRVLSWARQLCDVLEYLHTQQPPIIFRDVKPGNVMLSRDHRIKLIDFGIARIFRPNTSQDTQLLGTPGFAPPEQYGSAQTDERSDIYSLAITLFQLMTDTLPENGFGLRDIQASNPQISASVARALEKATALEPAERYENIAAFRRALLGIGTFPFEQGHPASTQEELAELCEHYPDEAADYIFSGDIETWLLSIGSQELAQTVKVLKMTVGDSRLLVERFLQAIQDAAPPSRGQTASRLKAQDRTGTISERRNSPASSQMEIATPRLKNRNGSRPSQASRPPQPRSNSIFGQRNKPTNPPPRQATWKPEIEQTILVRPAELDFGQVYPGISEAIPLTIAETHNEPVRGSLEPEHEWVRLNRETFEGVHTVIYVRVDSTLIPDPGLYNSSIVITSADDDIEADQAVKIKVEVLKVPETKALPQLPISKKRTGKQIAISTELPENDLPPLEDLGMMETRPRKGQFQQQEQLLPVDNELTRKYGQKGERWEPLKMTGRKLSLYQQALGFCTALMAAELPYGILPHLPQFSTISFLPPSPWFTIILLLMIPLATLGAALASWKQKNLINRLSTGLFLVLSTVEVGKFLLQNILNLQAPVQLLLIMLVLAALSATVGTNESFSLWLLNSALFGMKYARWLVTALAVFWGGLLGFGLTTGFAFGCLTGFGVALGVIVAVMLMLRLDKMLHMPEAPAE